MAVVLIILVGIGLILLLRVVGNFAQGYPWYWSWSDAAAYRLREDGQGFYADIIYGEDRGRLKSKPSVREL